MIKEIKVFKGDYCDFIGICAFLGDGIELDLLEYDPEPETCIGSQLRLGYSWKHPQAKQVARTLLEAMKNLKEVSCEDRHDQFKTTLHEDRNYRGEDKKQFVVSRKNKHKEEDWQEVIVLGHDEILLQNHINIADWFLGHMESYGETTNLITSYLLSEEDFKDKATEIALAMKKDPSLHKELGLNFGLLLSSKKHLVELLSSFADYEVSLKDRVLRQEIKKLFSSSDEETVFFASYALCRCNPFYMFDVIRGISSKSSSYTHSPIILKAIEKAVSLQNF